MVLLYRKLYIRKLIFLLFIPPIKDMSMQSDILEAVERNSTNWSPAVAEAFRQIYGKKHQNLNPTKHHGIVKENISYGPHKRNVLDVYTPTEVSTSQRPVMIYVHGGGLVAGDKSWFKGSLYANIGDYFASHGIVTVLINYRLVPDVTYPGGGDDIQMAREWVYHNISKTEFGNGDPKKVVLVGQSAGSLHIATNIYLSNPDSIKSESEVVFPPIAGIVYISTPFTFDSSAPEHNQTALRAYYNTEDIEEIHEFAPVGLMEILPTNSPLLDPRKLPCLIILAQYDPQEIQDATFLFIEEYRRKSPQGVLPEFVIVAGHNHISHVCSIGTEDDVQGRLLHEFICKVCSK
ncbi:Alpha/Beta hydrolase protein [Lentinula aciculospora]|uniref:Alpha/Beta hydrolase protein n=1 Tax=Lentinula aciculospora TaxID=153920 RepID=A0A9W9DQI1_9AGAR|nr:Alpha/Beta hydrolase protein [Lentinula aciculospora]